MAKEINFVRPQEVYEDGKSILKYRSYDGSEKSISVDALNLLNKEHHEGDVNTLGHLAYTINVKAIGTTNQFPAIPLALVFGSETIGHLRNVSSKWTADFYNEEKTFSNDLDAVNWLLEKVGAIDLSECVKTGGMLHYVLSLDAGDAPTYKSNGVLFQVQLLPYFEPAS